MRFSPDDDMLGGELAFDWRLAERRSAYVRLARGYKAGGFNVSLAGVDFGTVDNVNLSPENIEFDAESLTSIEAGIRASSADGRLRADVGVFVGAARRSADQGAVAAAARRSVVVPVRDGKLRARRAPRRRSDRRLAGDATPRAVGRRRLAASRDRRVLAVPELAGREQAHAPDVHVLARRDVRACRRAGGRGSICRGMDEFFFDYGHDQASEPYELANLSVGRDWDAWSVKLWARNVFDEDYFVRGFYFGNEPPDFPPTLYTRLGDPRHYGITVELSIVGAAMRVTAEMSLYPLQGQPLEKILAFIETIASDARLEVVVNQLSTQVRGELGVVMSTIATAHRALVRRRRRASARAQDPERRSADRRAAGSRAAVARPVDAASRSTASWSAAVAARGGRRAVQRALSRARDSREPLVLAGGVRVVGADDRRDVRRAALLGGCAERLLRRDGGLRLVPVALRRARAGRARVADRRVAARERTRSRSAAAWRLRSSSAGS